MTPLPPQSYSDDQLDGLACAQCGGRGGAMVPLPDDGPRGQMFVHLGECADAQRGAWEDGDDA
jgi:hypothetical protein